MIFELVITPFFWLILYKIQKPKDWLLGKIGETIDHSLPFTCLLAEYLLCSNLPFVRRHLPFIVLISFVYLSINMYYSITVEPVYKVITWQGIMGFLVPAGTAIGGVLIFLIIEFVTKKKLRWY